jgi:hypothetical protein
LQSATTFSIVTIEGGTLSARLRYRGRAMGTALRPISHLTAWLVWHAMRVSLLDDLDQPAPPHDA